ncbi:cellulose binding domain-containing protein [Lentzea sp. BCCO 10_0061]|uniref:Cellulose binding domain-containing protein n=1 Tax=Lentzea sokolovensis TaxID=3095429 RepID=A0ABU4VAY2_9PSEU|nr:cellulose binding domain-containing protein [Lentzea sp. BCCO 10_0061]MDX8148960.1 cellulose binding domain-containing protein [Lentzea sp. BCCO 10_0061]
MAARKHLVVLLTLLVAGCTASQDGRPFPAPRVSSSAVEKEPSTKVRAVVDGRTVELADGTRARIARLAEPPACAAAVALDFATKALLDKEVRVTSITPGEVSLALPDGTDYALLAVQYGILRTAGVDGGPLVEAETKASQAKLGLWAQDCPASTVPPPSSTAAPPSAPCVVVYRITGQWPGAFQGEVTIRNVSGALVQGWTVRWRFAGGETVTQLWNGTVAQSGADVSVTNADYNALIVTDGSVSFGFNGSITGPSSPPSSFSVNGAACTTG